MSEYPKLIEAVKVVAPKLAEMTETMVFGDVWQREGLSLRDRSLLTVATLIAMHRPTILKPHLRRALRNGVTQDEIREIIIHMAIYAGWPAAVSASEVAIEVFTENPTGY